MTDHNNKTISPLDAVVGLRTIHRIMCEGPWTPDTLDDIREALNATGFTWPSDEEVEEAFATEGWLFDMVRRYQPRIDWEMKGAT